jgi:hypothetical protein
MDHRGSQQHITKSKQKKKESREADTAACTKNSFAGRSLPLSSLRVILFSGETEKRRPKPKNEKPCPPSSS